MGVDVVAHAGPGAQGHRALRADVRIGGHIDAHHAVDRIARRGGIALDQAAAGGEGLGIGPGVLQGLHHNIANDASTVAIALQTYFLTEVDVVLLVDGVLALQGVEVHQDAHAAGIHRGFRAGRILGPNGDVSIIDSRVLAHADQRAVPALGLLSGGLEAARAPGGVGLIHVGLGIARIFGGDGRSAAK